MAMDLLAGAALDAAPPPPADVNKRQRNEPKQLDLMVGFPDCHQRRNKYWKKSKPKQDAAGAGLCFVPREEVALSKSRKYETLWSVFHFYGV